MPVATVIDFGGKPYSLGRAHRETTPEAPGGNGMASDKIRTAKKIADVNDLFRSTMLMSPRHKIVLTAGVAGLREQEPEVFQELLTAVRCFDDFNDDNDPNREHDFGAVEVEGERYFWKIDYYDKDFEYGLDPHEELTNLLMTIMYADEY
jgi:hypothetical protein